MKMSTVIKTILFFAQSENKGEITYTEKDFFLPLQTILERPEYQKYLPTHWCNGSFYGDLDLIIHNLIMANIIWLCNNTIIIRPKLEAIVRKYLITKISADDLGNMVKIANELVAHTKTQNAP